MVKKTYCFIFEILLVFCIQSAIGQNKCEPGAEQKAAKLYQSGRDMYHAGNNEYAIEYLNNSITICPSFANSWMLLGVIYEDLHSIDSSIMFYGTALQINPDIFDNAYYTLAKLGNSVGMYLMADSNISIFLSRPNISEKMKVKAESLLLKNRQALELSKNIVPFQPVNLGDSINTEYEEYLPIVSLDDSLLIFTRRYLRSEPKAHMEEDFFISSRDSLGEWTFAMRMPEPINSDGNEGAQSISADGRCLFFAGCNKEDGRGSCDIYVSVKNGDNWGEPINIGYPINTNAWESQPSISSDGRTLFFCSNRPGGFGGSDIWKSVRSNTGIWSEPINLGQIINTKENENSPFMHPDQRTLYFSSNGHPSLGGLDLFFSRLNELGEWDTAVNMGYPINTWADESTLSVNREGNTAYFSSSKLGGEGGLDIYRFELYHAARPELVSFMKGFVKDASTGKPLSAQFELIDLQTSTTTVESFSDETYGNFLVCLPAGKSYALNVSKLGYLFYSEHIVLDDTNAFSPLYKHINLSAVEPGKTMILRNIFFAVDQHKLDTTSFVELDKLLQFMLDNPTIRIEISGHTDASGSNSYNISLSIERAKSVASYLISNGISKDRIETLGLGSSKPISSNEDEDGRKLNRRTEIKVL